MLVGRIRVGSETLWRADPGVFTTLCCTMMTFFCSVEAGHAMKGSDRGV